MLFILCGAITIAHRTKGSTDIGGLAFYSNRLEDARFSLLASILKEFCSPFGAAGISTFILLRAFGKPAIRAFANIQCTIACALIALAMVGDATFVHWAPDGLLAPYPDMAVTTAIAFYGFIALAAERVNVHPSYVYSTRALPVFFCAVAIPLHFYYGLLVPLDLVGAAFAGTAILIAGAWLFRRYA